MTMNNNARRVPAGQFKAQCLALLDEVARSGRPLVVTKRGKPVAQVVPIKASKPRSLLGSVIEKGDIVAPLDQQWEAAG